jgi:diacylglycerol kinase (ATP)
MIGVVLNEAAGGGRCGRRAPAALAQLGADVVIRRTRRPGDGAALAQELAGLGASVVVSCGGDGTLFEVCNGLMGLDGPRPEVALLPLGTGNSFGRDFGVVDEASALAALRGGASRPFDVVRVTHAEGSLVYVNLLSVGFAADAGALTNRRFKGLGALGYIAAVIVQVGRLAPASFPCSVDGGPRRPTSVTLLSFSNTRYTGGDMMMAPAADPCDGQVDVITVGAMGRARLLSCFPRLFRGTHVAMDEVTAEQARVVDFEEGPAVTVMLDGEVLPLSLRRLEVLPGALRVRAGGA